MVRKQVASAILLLVRKWIGGIAVGGMLWGMWILLWRGAGWPILAVGGLFPVVILGAVKAAVLPMDFPLAAWFRLDLWATLGITVFVLVLAAVARAGWAIVRGRTRSGIVAIPVKLESDMGRLLLLWTITVTPGTIALLLEGDVAYVHCLHQPAGPSLPATAFVEQLLVRLWG